MKGLSDTSPDAMRVLIDCYRRMTPARRWKLMGDEYKFARSLHTCGVRSRNPQATDGDVLREWVRFKLGQGPWSPHLRFDMQGQPIENQETIRFVIGVLETEGIGYAVGGSLASSIHGVMRYTDDADLTVEPFPGKEAAFVSRFDPKEYYVDIRAVRDAIQQKSSFKIIRLSIAFKVDIFIRKERAFDQSMWQRRAKVATPDLIDFITPEDVILLKLEWYRIGEEISERQWNDVIGVMRVRKGQLDESYLDHWATELGVGDLLVRAREDAVIPG